MSYKVKKGDTLSGIAKAHNISLDELLKLNGISKDKANHINVGQELNIGQPSFSYETSEFQMPTATTPLITNTDWQFTPKPKDTDMGIPYAPGYTKSDFISDNAKTIQEQLVAAGYNVGNAGVDGKWGTNSQAALDRALAEGYILKGNQLVKPTLKPRKTATTPQTASTGIDPKYLKSNALSIQQQLKTFGYDLGTSGKNKDGVDGFWGGKSQTALDRALLEGYTLKDGKLVAPVKKETVQTPKPTGSAFYISYPKHSISTKGTPLEDIADTVPFLQGHAASIILDAGGNATYHTYGRYGDKGSYKTQKLPAKRSRETEKEYLIRIRPYLEYADAKEPVRATYISDVDAGKSRAYYKKQPEKGNYGFITGSTCVGEACNGIDAGRSATFGNLLQAIAPNFPESPHKLNYGTYETYDF